MHADTIRLPAAVFAGRHHAVFAGRARSGLEVSRLVFYKAQSTGTVISGRTSSGCGRHIFCSIYIKDLLFFFFIFVCCFVVIVVVDFRFGFGFVVWFSVSLLLFVCFVVVVVSFVSFLLLFLHVCVLYNRPDITALVDWA